MSLVEPQPQHGPDTPAIPSGAALARMLEAATARVTALEWQGRRLWLKRPEPHTSLRWRLQKGDPLRAFQREGEGLALLAELGAPVPRMLDAGPAHLLLEDAGPSLPAVLADPATGDDEAERAILAAARVLGRLHAQGLAHGRPYLRDICWDGEKIRLIDFERFRRRNSALRRGFDQMLFLASLLADPRGAAVFEAARAELRHASPPEVHRATRFWVGVLRLLAPAGRMALRTRPNNREIAGYLALASRGAG